MNGHATLPRVAVCVAVFLASLSLVAWRQGQAITVMTEVQQLEFDIQLKRADNDDLRGSIQYLESRTRVTEEAREKLGMRVPDASEQTSLQGVFE